MLKYYFNKLAFSLTGHCNHYFKRMGHDEINGRYIVFKECKICQHKHYLT